MEIFRKSKKKNNFTLVFDIGSASVGAALFETQKNGIPKIIYSVRDIIPIQDHIDFSNFMFLTIKTLQIVAAKICLAHLGAPDRIFCTLSSPWYASQTRVINFSKSNSFLFNEKLANNLINKEIKLFEKEYVNKEEDLNNVKILELKNIQTVLNGKVQGKIVGQKVKDVEITLFVSMSEKEFLNKIEDIVGQHFHIKKINFSSLPINTFSLVRDIFTNKDNFLLLDIGGEVTDIHMVNKDILTDSISFPLGFNYFFRLITEELNCSLDEAKSYLSLYKDKHMSESMGKNFEQTIDKLKRDWIYKFEESILGITNNLQIPTNIFITVDNNLSDFFGEIVKSEKFNKDIFKENKFEVISMDTKKLHGLASFSENIVRDPLLTIESIYINRFLT
ncbi:MAG: hypothetical protein WCX46_02565 [Candidatus Paceibacterota bacterium]